MCRCHSCAPGGDKSARPDIAVGGSDSHMGTRDVSIHHSASTQLAARPRTHHAPLARLILFILDSRFSYFDPDQLWRASMELANLFAGLFSNLPNRFTYNGPFHRLCKHYVLLHIT